MKKGRPTTFDAAAADRLLEAISDGASLTRACAEHGIARRTVRAWLAARPDFKQAHAAAVQLRFETLGDEVCDIADGSVGGDAAAIQSARLRVDSRRWLLSKLMPATYGDRVEISGDGGAALQAAPGPAQIPQLMSVLAVLLPGTPNNELHGLASKLIERAAPALPAPGGTA